MADLAQDEHESKYIKKKLEDFRILQKKTKIVQVVPNNFDL